MEYNHRKPNDSELNRVKNAFEQYTYGILPLKDEFPIYIIEDFECEDGTYSGKLAVVVDGGGNAFTYGFDENKAFLVSDSQL